MKWQWYITIAAIRQYMDILGETGPLEADNPAFNAAEEALGDLSLTARLTTARTNSGAEIYRSGTVRLDDRRRGRFECYVMPSQQSGDLPQLVRIAWKQKS